MGKGIILSSPSSVNQALYRIAKPIGIHYVHNTSIRDGLNHHTNSVSIIIKSGGR